jgi:hypothetical protein
MFNSKDYRAKAAEHQNRARGSHNTDEISEHRTLERTFSELADNAAWMEENSEQRIHPATQEVTAVEEESPSSENGDSAGLRKQGVQGYSCGRDGDRSQAGA